MSIVTFSNNEIQAMAVKAVEDVFSTMLCRSVKNTESVIANKTDVNQTPRPTLKSDGLMIAACVGYLGDVKGLVYIILENDFAITLSASLLGLEKSEVEEEGDELINDAVGEISNMITGTFKNQMSDKGFQCNLTVPSILRGEKITIDSPASETVDRFFFRFESHGREVVLDIVMKPFDK